MGNTQLLRVLSYRMSWGLAARLARGDDLGQTLQTASTLWILFVSIGGAVAARSAMSGRSPASANLQDHGVAQQPYAPEIDQLLLPLCLTAHSNGSGCNSGINRREEAFDLWW
jgi:hypothetical protein